MDESGLRELIMTGWDSTMWHLPYWHKQREGPVGPAATPLDTQRPVDYKNPTNRSLPTHLEEDL